MCNIYYKKPSINQEFVRGHGLTHVCHVVNLRVWVSHVDKPLLPASYILAASWILILQHCSTQPALKLISPWHATPLFRRVRLFFSLSHPICAHPSPYTLEPRIHVEIAIFPFEYIYKGRIPM